MTQHQQLFWAQTQNKRHIRQGADQSPNILHPLHSRLRLPAACTTSVCSALLQPRWVIGIAASKLGSSIANSRWQLHHGVAYCKKLGWWPALHSLACAFETRLATAAGRTSVAYSRVFRVSCCHNFQEQSWPLYVSWHSWWCWRSWHPQMLWLGVAGPAGAPASLTVASVDLVARSLSIAP